MHCAVARVTKCHLYHLTRRPHADALKKINISAMSHREIEDALSEVRFLASIRHSCIIGFLEAFVNPTSMELCIVQEFADGGDLAGKIQSYVRSGRGMPEKE